MSTKTERPSIAILESSDLQAKVQMKDGHTFFVAMAEAARACKAMNEAGDFSQQFNDLLAQLAKWVDANLTRIQSAYLTVRANDMLFVVMQRDVEFDPILAEMLVDLDLKIANDEALNLIDMEVLAIPSVSPDSCKAFLSSGEVYTYAK